MELMQASHQWATRPDDERFTSLTAMKEHFAQETVRSRAVVVSSRKIRVEPESDNRGLAVVGQAGVPFNPTHWAFGQLAGLASGPAGYLRDLPSPIAADCINWGLMKMRQVEDVGLLLYQNGDRMLRAATGPRYGRIWNADILSTLVDRIGDGVTSNWRVPGEFGKSVPVTKANTTLFAGDRDLFIFLCDEVNRIEFRGRRNGQGGMMARGFFLWNSEVGSKTFGLGTFLFDYVCCNRIVWGAEGYQEITMRHTASAPDRWLEEIQPALESYAHSSDTGIVAAIEDARSHRLDDLVDDFLANRFGKRMVEPIKAVHMLEEGRPIETRWDAITGATAYAKSIKWQDDRVDMERKAGALLQAA